MNRHKHAELTHALRNAAQRDPILRDLLVQVVTTNHEEREDETETT